MHDNPVDLPQIIRTIHRNPSPVKLVIAMAGSGTQAISELMRYGNGSATLLAQHLLYDNAAFNTYIGGAPDKYVSAQASRQLAMAAYIEGRKIAGGSYPTAGIGCTSSLVKPDGERDGREHVIYVSTQDRSVTRTDCIQLDAMFKRTRVEEEWINSLAILAAVASCRGSGDAIGGILRNALVETDVAETDANTGQDQSLSDVVHSTAGWHIHHAELPTGPCVVCAGSFNPLHPAHIRLLELARSMTHLPGYFELSITNVDKPPLDFIEIEKRMRQFEQQQLSLMLTNRPRYLGKAELFPIGSYFVMGSDTYARLVDQRYYGNAENPLERFEARQTKFIVAARRQDHGTVLGGEDILRSLHETDAHQASRWRQITLCIPREEFLMDVSSSAIRGGQLKI